LQDYIDEVEVRRVKQVLAYGLSRGAFSLLPPQVRALAPADFIPADVCALIVSHLPYGELRRLAVEM